MKNDYKKAGGYLLLGLIGIAFYHMIGNFDTTITYIRGIAHKFSPIATAFVIAFILNIPMVSIEKILFEGKERKKEKSSKIKSPRPYMKSLAKISGDRQRRGFSTGGKRVISLITTLIVVTVLISVIGVIIMPQVVDSIKQLISNIPDYVSSISEMVNEKTAQWGINQDVMNQVMTVWENTINNFVTFMLSFVDDLYSYVSQIVAGLFNLIISAVLAIYMLLSKEKLFQIIQKVYRAYFPKKYQEKTLRHLNMLNNSFQQFVRGQIIEAIIISILCYIGMLIFRFDYALLISVIIGITNIIPMFGPYIGGIPSVLLLLTVNPISALWFIVFLAVLQQIEGNLIYPRVVGNSLGISGFWILTVVIIGNNMFGIVGILLGIPIFSTIYIIFKEMVEERLRLLKE